jgi:hypothetical protein
MRVQFEHPVKCLTPQVIFEGKAANLGLHGLGLLSPIPLEIGTEMAVLFSFTPEGETPFLALAEVIWGEEGEEENAQEEILLGLRFLNLGRSKEALLGFLIRQLALSGYLTSFPGPA